MPLRVPAADFSLRDTLESGQAFRWKSADEGYTGFLDGTGLKVAQDGDALLVTSRDPAITPESIRRYFALDLPLTRVLAAIDVDPHIHAAIQRHPGLRILRQDPWECLASFICSSFNNIARIRGMIERLCQAYGEGVGLNGVRGHAFPTPAAIAGTSERRLRELGLGFRAPYLRATARRVAEGLVPFAALRHADYRTTKEALLACDGVGEKVADCIALFGFEQYEAFPVDVWMARAMRPYFAKRKMTPARLQAFARRHFGCYAGYAQQYLYHDVRTSRRAG